MPGFLDFVYIKFVRINDINILLFFSEAVTGQLFCHCPHEAGEKVLRKDNGEISTSGGPKCRWCHVVGSRFSPLIFCRWRRLVHV